MSSKENSGADAAAAPSAPTIFYAYARRIDSYWASRYLLTFVSAAVANEWWELIQSEYPDQGHRDGPQLFSFNGDNFPSKPANSKRFEHLKTKWFYSQFGDATGTGGRSQDVIPLQDYEGNLIGGGGGGGGGHGGGDNGGGMDMSSLASSLDKTRSTISDNASAISTLTSTQSTAQTRLERMEKLLEQSATQIKTLSEAQSSRQQRSQSLAEQNANQLKAFTKAQTAAQEQLQQASAQVQSLLESQAAAQQQTKELAEQNGKLLRELRRQRQQQQQQQQPATQSSSQNGQETKAAAAGGASAKPCPHDVRPPPRKIDKAIVGYDYGGKARAGGGGGGTAASKKGVAAVGGGKKEGSGKA